MNSEFREIRMKSGYSQADIARALNIKQQAVSKWENQHYAIPHLTPSQTQILIRMLGITLDKLVELEKPSQQQL